MNTQQEYKLLEGQNTYTLSDAVSKHLKEGWVLYGSPAVAYDNRTIFIQAVTRTIQLPDR